MLNAKNEKLLERIKKRMLKEYDNFKEEEALKVGQLVVYYEEDGENESCPGAGDGQAYDILEYFKLIEKDNRLFFKRVGKEGQDIEDDYEISFFLDTLSLDNLFDYHLDYMNW